LLLAAAAGAAVIAGVVPTKSAAKAEPPFYAAATLGSWRGVVSSDGQRYPLRRSDLVDSGAAGFSPRGATVVWGLCCLRGGAKLAITDLGGSTRVVPIGALTSQPVFAADGRIAYGSRRIVRFLNGATVRPHGLPRGAMIRYVAVSPRDPLTVAATVTWGSKLGAMQEALYIVSPKRTRRVRISFDALSELPQPVWSPDGDRLAFARSGTSRGGDIYVVDADGAHIRQLTRSTRALGPVWSPDGRELAFTQRYGFKAGRSNGLPEVYITDLRGNTRRLTHTTPAPPPKHRVFGNYIPPGSHAGAWSPDGRWIAVLTNGALGVVPANGGRERILASFNVPIDLIDLGPVAWPRA